MACVSFTHYHFDYTLQVNKRISYLNLSVFETLDFLQSMRFLFIFFALFVQ